MKIFKKHVSAADLWVRSNERLSDYYASSWQRGESPVPMLLIRGALLAVALGVLIWALTNNTSAGGPSPYWLIYLTNWGLLLNTTLMLTGFIVSVVALCSKLPEYEVTPVCVSVYWLFYNIAISVAFLITLLYWVLLYNPEAELEIHFFWLDLSTHGFNSCICFIELVFSRTPTRALHIYQPAAVGLLYAAFSGIYYAAGGLDSLGNPFIYPVLDWREPGQVVVIIVVALVAIIAIYCVIYFLAMARDTLSKRYIRTKGHDLPQAPSDTGKIV